MSVKSFLKKSKLITKTYSDIMLRRNRLMSVVCPQIETFSAENSIWRTRSTLMKN